MIFCVSANERSGLGALGLGRRRPDGTPPEGAGDPIEAIEPLVTRDGGTSLKTPARSVYTRLVNQGRIPGSAAFASQTRLFVDRVGASTLSQTTGGTEQAIKFALSHCVALARRFFETFPIKYRHMSALTFDKLLTL